MSRNPLGSGLGVSSLRVQAEGQRGPEVAIPSVRVSVFRHSTLPGCREDQERRVAIPSVRVSVFRQATNHNRRALPDPPGRNPLGLGLGVSSLSCTRSTIFAITGLSQSPRFGSRCFVPDDFRPDQGGRLRPPRRNPLGSGLGVSSRCLVMGRDQDRSGVLVAIPSVRVSVFRL